jgi:hypothetical protein
MCGEDGECMTLPFQPFHVRPGFWVGAWPGPGPKLPKLQQLSWLAWVQRQGQEQSLETGTVLSDLVFVSVTEEDEKRNVIATFLATQQIERPSRLGSW